jgi:DNA-binding FadR family transcriptional regulator
VLLTPHPLRRFGVSRDAGYDALGRLDDAGLIQVRRKRGRMPKVTLLEPDAQQPLAAG